MIKTATSIVFLSLSMLVSLSLNAEPQSAHSGFKLDPGPWHISNNGDTRKRSINLILQNKIVDMCMETEKNGQSDALQRCSFLQKNQDGHLEVDQSYALKKLHHGSGMNLDGSTRRFYHEWLGID